MNTSLPGRPEIWQMNEQIATLNTAIAQAMKPHQETVTRLAGVPDFGIDSAQQVIAEVGVTASTFSSAAEFTSWVGTCPGKEESAESIERVAMIDQ